MSAAPSSPPDSSPGAAPTPPPAGVFAHRRVRRWVKLLVIVLCVAALGTVGYFAIYPQAHAYYCWRRAQHEIDRYAFDRAREDLESCTQVWKDSGEAHFVLGRTCRRQGDFETARAQLHEARRLGWIDQQIRLEYLLLQAQMGAVPAVEKSLGLLIGTGHPDERLILEALIEGGLRCRFLQSAYRWANLWVESHPDDWRARYWNGRVQESLQNEVSAVASYMDVVAKAPFFMEGHLRLAEQWLRQGRYQEALEQFQTVLQTEPRDAEALLGVARCQHVLPGTAGKAKVTLDRVLEIYPEDVPALVLRGQIELEDDQAAAALPFLKKATQLAPGERSANKHLAAAYRRLGDVAQAKRCEERGRLLEEAYRRLQGLVKQASAAGDTPDLRAEAGHILLQLNEPADAVQWLISALLIDPNLPQARQDLAACSAHLGDQRLRSQLEQFLARGPAIAP